MKILAIDTTSGACSAALYADGRICEQFFRAERDHTRRLLPMVEAVLAEGQSSLTQVDALAVSQGPGSFTGLRIAISCVQGLAFAADKPVVPVSSLAALSRGARRSHPDWGDAPVLAALDARMQEVYWGLYPPGEGANALLADAVSTPEQVVSSLKSAGFLTADTASTNCSLYAVGPGWEYPALAALKPLAVSTESAIHAQDIAVLAAELWQRGIQVSAEELEPAYLRNEVTWKKRARIRQR
ncbi:tRNA (adenosine(37)-N6)-threonylcarbamoyltransferase complex dimerization subunit type 1 TsaB [Microbulbifer harenosus]|uniref:tRNA threonylcarbamoyladenosine biosynthesis protein TsaB n=1 Tax=Microbulbifer harenosus TaxID=2576840 RepID=A0ABY2UIC4_9GAMM|nr:tRNA (adenosine(37)-N6)-threonylcarbamoyltransferase complex dimerization subunit type 1 TsaB [Microbulbifer harenosus]TLM77618.1 tRNA (adenosine(37)-N6)-threonylcarbamoyltransferase complex dimerization subunit type 1 TsaB [Microbulbifer harenosus]